MLQETKEDNKNEVIADSNNEVSNSKGSKDKTRNTSIAKEEYEVEKMGLEQTADWLQ